MNVMIRVILPFAMLLTIQQHLFSQNNVIVKYHSLANQACKSLEDGFVEQAYIFLTEAFSLSGYPIAADLLNMAKCHSQMNEPDSTERYINLALDRNPKIGRVVRMHNLWFEPVLGTEKWEEIVQKTYEIPLIPLEVQEQVLKLRKVDSMNRVPQNRPNEFNNKEYWNSVKERAMINAPLLDSILLIASDSQLIHPAFEESFLNIIFFYDVDYWISRKEMYMKLIEKGFLTPDILASVFIEEHFGKKNDFNFLSYSPGHIDYYDKYGVSFDYYMSAFRLFNDWRYDEKEQ